MDNRENYSRKSCKYDDDGEDEKEDVFCRSFSFNLSSMLLMKRRQYKKNFV